MPHYELLYPVRHDGVRYEPPAVVEMSEPEAAALLAAGIVNAAAMPAAEAAPQTGVLDLTPQIVAQVFAERAVKTDKQPTLAQAVRILGKNTDAGTTDDGIRLVIDPKTLTQELLDEAWGIYTAAQDEP
ncbi:MAG: hypothetical protein Q4A06_02540 [Cardiobacteriaceae bacterium]|nr:hypothetical protein [Cardiobacteriaceae bacterium]